ncbi:WG repeat-containing protein [Defluviitalea saccharophila]|uniref:WG repeat-containing protein n=1 Tax=Defluviitalea saccharophila TaxID=879970 RepID=A0ABZ2Y5Y4_9FIRM
MLRGMALLEIARFFLPKEAVFTPTHNYNDYTFMQTGDIDGDGAEEIIVGYLWRKQPFVMILKNIKNRWYRISTIKGIGYDINSINLAPTSSSKISKKDIIIKWVKDQEVLETNVFTWKLGKLYKLEEETKYCRREEVSAHTESLHPIKIYRVGGVQWGYINDQGEIVIPPQYDYGEPFQENGLAVVNINELYGVIDSSGAYVIPPQYSYIGEFSEGRTQVRDGKETKMIDEKGNVLFVTNGDIFPMNNNRAPFSIVDEENGWKYGYIDREGNVVIPPQYRYARSFEEGKAVVEKMDGGYSIIDTEGNIISDLNYAFVGGIGEGLLSFQETLGERYGYIDFSGNIIIPVQFDTAEEFQDGRAVVSIQQDSDFHYGLIDRNGKYIISPQYNYIRILGENRIGLGLPVDENNSVWSDSKYAIGDLDGNILTDFIYYDLTDYNKGYASANDGLMTFFINREGKKVDSLPAVEGNGSLNFEGNIIGGSIDYRIIYLDRDGNVIWHEENSLQLNDQYRVQEKKYAPNRYYLVYYPEIIGIKDEVTSKEVNERLRKMSKAEGINKDEIMDSTYYGDYIVTFFKNALIGIELNGYSYTFGAAHGMPSKVYAHINLETGDFYELKDLFKKNSNYVEILSEIIKEQIIKEGEDSYVWLDSYQGIRPNQSFYITDTALHIYFDPYEIAPYAAGFPTFEIPFEDIMNIIDTEGDFWRNIQNY